ALLGDDVPSEPAAAADPVPEPVGDSDGEPASAEAAADSAIPEPVPHVIPDEVPEEPPPSQTDWDADSIHSPIADGGLSDTGDRLASYDQEAGAGEAVPEETIAAPPDAAEPAVATDAEAPSASQAPGTGEDFAASEAAQTLGQDSLSAIPIVDDDLVS